jgi:hypothetical protein
MAISKKMSAMQRFTVVFALACLAPGTWVFADEHEVTAADQIMPVGRARWVYGGKRSMGVGGEDAEPGKDGPWRLHIKVKKGDRIAFKGSSVVFENGADEVDKVWEIALFQAGPKGKLQRLTDPKQRAFYKNPDKALLSVDPAPAPDGPWFVIRIKDLSADRPILFASGEVTHVAQTTRPGQKANLMFGAIVLDAEK